jgi:translation initiation factor IF-3
MNSHSNNRSFDRNKSRRWVSPYERKYPRNEWIKGDKVRVISDDGENLGEMSLDDARTMAQDKDLDLVLISPNAQPPVTKIIEWSKFLYNLKKKEKEAQKNKQKDLKEIRFGTYIDIGDKQRLLKRAQEFLNKGHNVKITVTKKGRTPMSDSKALLDELLTAMGEYSTIDSSPSRSGRMISMTLKGEEKKGKNNGKTKDKQNSSKKIQDDKTQGKQKG